MHNSSLALSNLPMCLHSMLKPVLALQKFPREYTDAIKQAQNSTAAALAAGLRLLEIEFPTSSLASVSGALADPGACATLLLATAKPVISWYGTQKRLKFYDVCLYVTRSKCPTH